MANGASTGDDWYNHVGGSDDINPKTLYIGNLDPSVTEEFISQLFGQIGSVNKCKIIHETGNDPYAFVEFADNASAVQGLTAMNRRVLLGREMKVNWATHPGQSQKVDTSKHFHIFVGDLSLDIDNKTLKDAFQPFGEISECKVIKDLQTLKSKGYGFVTFTTREDAERAIEQMNGQWLGRKTIRTNWATRKPFSQQQHKQLSYDEVWSQSGPNNCSVYVGNIPNETQEEEIRNLFCSYGNILEVRIFRTQGFCFVKYDSKQSACHSIVNMNNYEVGGNTIRCSWGREESGPQSRGGGGGGGGGSSSGASGPPPPGPPAPSADPYAAPSGGSGYNYPYPTDPAAMANAYQYWANYYNYYQNYQNYAQQWNPGSWDQTAGGWPGYGGPPGPGGPPPSGGPPPPGYGGGRDGFGGGGREYGRDREEGGRGGFGGRGGGRDYYNREGGRENRDRDREREYSGRGGGDDRRERASYGNRKRENGYNYEDY